LSNPWWRRRKKKNPWVNDIYEELEKLGNLIDETMQKSFDPSSEKTPSRRSRIQGFSIKIGPDGKPRIQEFTSRQPRRNETEISDEDEPLVDLIEDGETLVVLAALPGLKKDDIDLRITESCLTVSVDTDEFEWYNEFKLPTKVDPKSACASYKNGVLEVKAKKLEKLARDGRISVKK
jgi:HSP20 family protein